MKEITTKSGHSIRNVQKVPIENNSGYSFVFEAKNTSDEAWNKYGPDCYRDWSSRNTGIGYVKVGFWELKTIWESNSDVRQTAETYISSNGIKTGVSVSNAQQHVVTELKTLVAKVENGDFLTEKDFNHVIFLCGAIKKAINEAMEQ